MSKTKLTLSGFSIGVLMAILLIVNEKTVCAQNLEAILPNGKKVLLNGDATWRYAQDTKAAVSKPCVYQEKNVRLKFEYQKTGSSIRVLITNISQTKILKPDTHCFAYNEHTDSGGFLPQISSVEDNFGNSFHVGSIEPMIVGRLGAGINPGQTKELNVSFVGTPLPNTASLTVTVPRKVFGNDQEFEITLPLRTGVTSRIRYPMARLSCVTPRLSMSHGGPSISPVPRLSAPIQTLSSVGSAPAPGYVIGSGASGAGPEVNPYSKFIYTRPGAEPRLVPPLRPLPPVSANEPLKQDASDLSADYVGEIKNHSDSNPTKVQNKNEKVSIQRRPPLEAHASATRLDNKVDQVSVATGPTADRPSWIPAHAYTNKDMTGFFGFPWRAGGKRIRFYGEDIDLSPAIAGYWGDGHYFYYEGAVKIHALPVLGHPGNFTFATKYDARGPRGWLQDTGQCSSDKRRIYRYWFDQ